MYNDNNKPLARLIWQHLKKVQKCESGGRISNRYVIEQNENTVMYM